MEIKLFKMCAMCYSDEAIIAAKNKEEAIEKYFNVFSKKKDFNLSREYVDKNMKCVNNDVLEVLDIYNPANREFSLMLREKYND